MLIISLINLRSARIALVSILLVARFSLVSTLCQDIKVS